MITELWRVLAICIVGGFFSVILRQKSAEYSLAVGIITAILVLVFVLKTVSEPISEIADRLSAKGIETEYFKVALKAIGIAYITDFTAEACRDAGQSSIASKAELAGKSAIFLLSVPLLMSVLETALGFIK